MLTTRVPLYWYPHFSDLQKDTQAFTPIDCIEHGKLSNEKAMLEVLHRNV
jgi:hypothetical protein